MSNFRIGYLNKFRGAWAIGEGSSVPVRRPGGLRAGELLTWCVAVGERGWGQTWGGLIRTWKSHTCKWFTVIRELTDSGTGSLSRFNKDSKCHHKSKIKLKVNTSVQESLAS